MMELQGEGQGFEYTIQAHETLYAGTRFRSRLEATWAAFFDLARWEWRYEPVDLAGWTPDFWVRIPCKHSECTGSHELYVEVKPFDDLEGFKGHPAHERLHSGATWTAPHPAIFGVHPDVTQWVMAHGAGGGIEWVPGWVSGTDTLWAEAGNMTRWKPRRGPWL